MSTGQTEPSEQELRAAYEAEIKRVTVDQVVLENVVTLINLGMRRTGLSPGTEDERDLGQVRTAIESVRAQMPLLEQSAPAQAGAIRDALSQLQLAYVRIGGQPTSASQPVGGEGGQSGAPGGSGAPPGGSGAPPGGSGRPPGGSGGPPGGSGGPPGGSGGPPGGSGAPGGPAAPKPGEPGPAQRSGRLWVPGQ